MCPRSAERDPLGAFLPRRWPDRLLAFLVTLVFLSFGAGMVLGAWGWRAADMVDRISKQALLHGGVAVVLFCLAEIVWLFFTPLWVERFLRRRALMAVLALALFLPGIILYLAYYMFVA
ncbi:MAG: hypothetical protein ACLQVA_16395 [Candidatus Brocadiia bacterium]